MKIAKTDKTNEKIKYVISFDIKEWSELKKHAFNNLVKNLNVVGFRKGHVPLDIAKKHISENAIITEAIDNGCKKAHKEIVIPEIIEKTKDIFVDTLSYGIEKIDEQNFEITCEFNLFPVVTIPEYTKTNLKFKTSVVTREEIDKGIDDLLKKDTLLVPKDGDTIEKGDTVVFDFKGFIDNKPFDGGEAKLFELEIGSNQFIPGFEEQMIGLKKDSEKTIKVKFPKDYHAKDFAGKEATFELNIRDIKTTQKPKLDDQYVKTLNIDGVNNKQELEKYISKQIENEYVSKDRQSNMTLIYDYFKKNSQLSYFPNFLIAKEKEQLKNSLTNNAQNYNLTFEKFMETNFQVKNEKEIDNKLNELAKDNIVLIYALSKLINDLNIQLTDNDRKLYFEDISKIYHMPVDEIKKILEKNQNIDEIILQNKLVDKIIQLNK